MACPQCGFSQTVPQEDEPGEDCETGEREPDACGSLFGDADLRPLGTRRDRALLPAASPGEAFPIPTAEFRGECEFRVRQAEPHRAPRMPSDKILFPRRMIYVEGVLYLAVALAALGAGYLVGRGRPGDTRRLESAPPAARSAFTTPAVPEK